MIILAIETSTTQGSVALLRDGEALLTTTFTSERSHNSQIFAPLAEALELGVPDLIVVGTGPGSYTGARIGIAAGIGISLTHSARLIGLPSVTAAVSADSYRLVGDARRKLYFYAEVEKRQLVRDPELIDAEALAEMMAEVADGSGSSLSSGSVISFDPKPPAKEIELTLPSAEVLGSIAAGLEENQVSKLASASVVPHYMSAPFVTAPKQK